MADRSLAESQRLNCLLDIKLLKNMCNFVLLWYKDTLKSTEWPFQNYKKECLWPESHKIKYLPVF